MRIYLEFYSNAKKGGVEAACGRITCVRRHVVVRV
jgi:hypothetical protein